MKPNAGQIVGTTAAQLMTQIVPLLPESYAQSTTALLGILLGFCAQEFENAAEIRAIENAEMRDLLAALEPHMDDSRLRARLGMVMAGRDASLRISELDAMNGELRRLLIDVQSHLEEIPTVSAKSQLRKIWAILQASAERRMLKLPGA